MEPFDILSTPSRIGPVRLATIGLLLLVTAALVFQTVFTATRILTADDGSTAGTLVLVPLVGLSALCVWLSRPQYLLLRRYYREDRGKHVVTFRLDHEGWRWMQVGTDVLMPWEGLRISVLERTPTFYKVRVVHPEPVLVSRDPLSRLTYRTLKQVPHTDVPFTPTDPTEDELAVAVETRSGGRVVLER